MHKHWLTGVALGTLGLAAIANAEVIGTGSGQQDTLAPVTSSETTISGWNNVGQVNGASGVYLGNGWVITADHVGPGDFTLNGATYDYDGTAYELDTPSSYGTSSPVGTDLALFQLSSIPTAPAQGALALPSSEPTSGEEIFSVGYGLSRPADEGLTYYQLTGPGNNLTWTTTSEESANAAGYQESGGGTKMWGNNNITTYNASTGQMGGSSDPVVNTFSVNGDDVQGVITEFYTQTTSESGGDTEESQLAAGDSGGGVFNDAGQLIGINDAVLLFSNQPGSTAVLGNASEYVDLYEYENQIESITGVPEPATGLLLMVAAGAAVPRRRRVLTRDI